MSRAGSTERRITAWACAAAISTIRISVSPRTSIASSTAASVGYGIYSYSILLISTLSSLVSFAIILFNLSADFTIPGTDIAVPGFLFWVALVYAGIGTVVTHLIGRPLTRLYFAQQRYEADFRFSLVRLREYGEQVALLGGEPVEQRSAMGRFGQIFANYMAIINRRKQLLAFTASYGQISPFIPYIVAAPFYFAGKIQLGIMSQTAGAFGRVNEALTFFVTYYTSLADFKAVLDRLTTFDEAIESARVLGTVPPHIEQIPSHGTAIELADLTLGLPDGRVIVADTDVVFDAHQPALIVGPSGSGKSTLAARDFGNLALWPRPRVGAGRCARDARPAKALSADRVAARCGGLSRRARHLHGCGAAPGARGGAAA